MGHVTDKSEKSANDGRGDQPVAPAKTDRSKTMLILIGLVVAAAVAAGVYYARGGFTQHHERVADKDKVDPSVSDLMAPGPLPEMIIGSANAPNTIVEYASMTCPHCAVFQTTILPELKTKYIDTGKARYILREFPLDNLAVAAFMLARCAGNDRYFPMIDALFATQENWAVPGAGGKDKLLLIARQAGMSKEEFDKCLADKDLFKKIVDVRTRGNEVFQVDSTPTFFINGKRLKGDHQLKDFQVAFGEVPTESSSGNAKTSDAKTGGTAPPAQTEGAKTESAPPPAQTEGAKTEAAPPPAPTEGAKTEAAPPPAKTEGATPPGQ